MTYPTHFSMYARVRTWLRGRLPAWAGPTKVSDCGNHRWYRESEGVQACYDCEERRQW